MKSNAWYAVKSAKALQCEDSDLQHLQSTDSAFELSEQSTCKNSLQVPHGSPMTWNYRIMRHRQEQAEWFAIHEVYYNEQGTPVSVTQEPIRILCGDDEGEEPQAIIKSMLETMLRDVQQPILDFEMFSNQKVDEVTQGIKSLQKGNRLDA